MIIFPKLEESEFDKSIFDLFTGSFRLFLLQMPFRLETNFLLGDYLHSGDFPPCQSLW